MLQRECSDGMHMTFEHQWVGKDEERAGACRGHGGKGASEFVRTLHLYDLN